MSSRLLKALPVACLAFLAACGTTPPAVDAMAAEPPAVEAATLTEGSLAWAVAGDWREAADRARDDARNPVETLEFFRLRPGMTVVELSPGGGYWTDILAPWAKRNGATYIAAFGDPVNGTPAQIEARNTFAAQYAARPEIFGTVQLGQFGPRAGAIAAPESADLVMSMRGFHGFRLFNWTDKALADVHSVLRPGGLFAIEAHRGANAPTDGSLGYLPQQFVIDTVTAAGFTLVATSEINANPRDTANHPFGVWTLPPTLQTAPRGQPADPNFDTAPFRAIGESDRMTLLFRRN
jgi:predicted methyltransferase